MQVIRQARALLEEVPTARRETMRPAEAESWAVVQGPGAVVLRVLEMPGIHQDQVQVEGVPAVRRETMLPAEAEL
jgi:hypothetical protein